MDIEQDIIFQLVVGDTVHGFGSFGECHKQLVDYFRARLGADKNARWTDAHTFESDGVIYKVVESPEADQVAPTPPAEPSMLHQVSRNNETLFAGHLEECSSFLNDAFRKADLAGHHPRWDNVNDPTRFVTTSFICRIVGLPRAVVDEIQSVRICINGSNITMHADFANQWPHPFLLGTLGAASLLRAGTPVVVTTDGGKDPFSHYESQPIFLDYI